MQVPKEGSYCWRLYLRTCEQKSIEATTVSRQHSYPLQIRVEKE